MTTTATKARQLNTTLMTLATACRRRAAPLSGDFRHRR
jgi:hypothetical protein